MVRRSQAIPACQPPPGAFQTKIPNADGSGFVVKFDTNKTPATSVVYATYLGGTNGTGARTQLALTPQATLI